MDFGIGWLLVGIAVYAAVPEVESETLTSSQEESVGIATLIAISVWINYLVFAEWRWGSTIGKAALGIKVVSLDGGPLSWNAALVRNLLRLPDLIAIFFTVPTSEHRQRLGDRAAKTVVLRLREDERVAAPAGRLSQRERRLGQRARHGRSRPAARDHLPRRRHRLGLRPRPGDHWGGPGPPGPPGRRDDLRAVPGRETRGVATPAELGLGPSLRAPVATAAIGYITYLGARW